MKTFHSNFAGALLTLYLLGLLSACSSANPERARLQVQVQEAQAMFQEHCKSAGVKIYRTADNVEGVLLMKLRPEGINYGDQFELDDPYGRDLGGEGYIETFVRGSYQANTRGTDSPGAPPRLGYLYVEAIDPKDGKRYRYKGRIDQPWLRDKRYGEWVREFVLDKTPATGAAPRYGITYDDISTHADREHWIAGSSLKVIDLKTNEVMAERIGYMWDPGQGNDGGGRSPWLMAADYACPTFQRNPFATYSASHGAASQPRQAQDFVEKILKPKLKN